ncbi:MAG: hypothetical protein ACRD5D_04760 [Candidatus Polarisedimenticolia bacterium]
MRHHLLSASVVSLLLCVATYGLAAAAPKGDKGRHQISRQLTASPASVSSPVSSTSRMSFCVSGFAEGNFVSIVVPWVGSVESHSNLSFSKYVDATGGFCVTAPPDWTTLQLSTGTYTVDSYWYSDGTSGDRRSGPSTTFVVDTQ